MAPRPRRRRATAIVEYPDGILVTVMRYMACGLPGGSIQPGEAEEVVVVRELREETCLIAEQAILLFHYETAVSDHAVFWVLARGTPEPCGKVDQLAYYRPGSTLNLSPEAQAIIERYYAYRAEHEQSRVR
jgi:ADP-ribose pyrophosphatase YjhB (NUDIX family)